MKWLLLLVVIVLSIMTYKLQQSLDEERKKLQAAEAQVANLQDQIHRARQQNPFLFPPSNTPAAASPWKPHGTDLDKPPSGQGRGKR